MVTVEDYTSFAVPTTQLAYTLGQDTTSTQPPATIAPTGPGQAVGIAVILAAGLSIVGGIYYWKSAERMDGFWKGWGYVNGVLTFLGAGVAILAGLGLVAMPDKAWFREA